MYDSLSFGSSFYLFQPSKSPLRSHRSRLVQIIAAAFRVIAQADFGVIVCAMGIADTATQQPRSMIYSIVQKATSRVRECVRCGQGQGHTGSGAEDVLDGLGLA